MWTKIMRIYVNCAFSRRCQFSKLQRRVVRKKYTVSGDHIAYIFSITSIKTQSDAWSGPFSILLFDPWRRSSATSGCYLTTQRYNQQDSTRQRIINVTFQRVIHATALRSHSLKAYPECLFRCCHLESALCLC